MFQTNAIQIVHISGQRITGQHLDVKLCGAWEAWGPDRQIHHTHLWARTTVWLAKLYLLPRSLHVRNALNQYRSAGQPSSYTPQFEAWAFMTSLVYLYCLVGWEDEAPRYFFLILSAALTTSGELRRELRDVDREPVNLLGDLWTENILWIVLKFKS